MISPFVKPTTLYMPVRKSATDHNLSTPSNADPHSNPEQSTDTSTQSQRTYDWLTTSIFGFFQWFFLTIIPVTPAIATLFQGARNFNISGNPTLMNIGTNTGNLTTVNNYGGTHGVSFSVLPQLLRSDQTSRLGKVGKSRFVCRPSRLC